MTELGSKSPGAGPWAAVAVLISGLAAHWSGFGGAFVYDDLVTIVGNPHLAPLWPPGSTLWAVPDSGLAGRPVVSFSLALNHALGGLDAWGYHLVNLAGHLAAALLLLFVVRETLRTERLASRFGAAAGKLALVSALLWVVHPLTTSAVTYIYQRSEVAMGCFLLATLAAAMRSWTSPRPGRWWALAICACWLGVGSKETMLAAPLLVLAHDALFGAGSVRSAWVRRRTLYVGLFSSWLLLAALLVHSGAHQTSVGFSGAVGAWDYLKTQAVALVLYLELAFWPSPLVFDYGWPVPTEVSAWVLSGAIVLGLLIATGVALWRSRPMGFLGLWFFAILAPTSSVLPIVTELVVEHRMYAPLIAVLVLAVCCAHVLGQRLRWSEAGARRFGLVAVLLAGLVLGLLTDRRNRQYADPELLWSESLRLAPGNARAHYVLGDMAREEGRSDEALGHYLRSVELQPEEPFWRLNPGVLAYELGDLELAREQLSEAVRLKPDWALAHYNLGLVRTRAGVPLEAAASFEAALRSSPGYLDALRGLGIARARAGQQGAAVRDLEQVLRVVPQDLEALSELAQLLILAPDAALRDGARAAELARRGNRLAGGADAHFLTLLAGAQAEQGDFAAAVATMDRALRVCGPDAIPRLRRQQDAFAAGRTRADG